MSRSSSSLRPLVLSMLSVVLSGYLLASSDAGVLTHYVPFDAGYPGGNDLNGSGGSDLGFGANTWFDGGPAGNASSVVAGNLSSPPGLPVAGNSASTHPSDFDLAFYTMDRNNNGSNGEVDDRLEPGVHWLSFLARSEADAFFGGLSLVKFFGPEVLYIGKVGGGGGTEWGFDQGAAGVVAASGSDATQDTFMVVKLTIGAGANDDTADLYINPPLGAAPPAVPDVIGYAFNENASDNRAIDEIRLGSQNGAFAADEIRIGDSYSAVAAPEPTSVTLILSSLGAFGWSNRRKRESL